MFTTIETVTVCVILIHFVAIGVYAVGILGVLREQQRARRTSRNPLMEEKLRETRLLVRLGLSQVASPLVLVTPVILVYSFRHLLPDSLFMAISELAWLSVLLDGILTLAILKPYRIVLFSWLQKRLNLRPDKVQHLNPSSTYQSTAANHPWANRQAPAKT